MKKLFTILVAFVCFGFLLNAQINLQNGLVSFYPFNGNANDESGNGNNGTVNGNVTLTIDRFGNLNSAYEFPGVAFNYISVPHSNSLALNTFTINAWIFSETDYGSGQIVQKNRDIRSGHYGLYTTAVIGKVDYYNNIQATNSEQPTLGQWHMITGYVSGNRAKFYVDGTLIYDSIAPNSYTYSGTDQLAIGMHYYSGVPNFWTYPYKGKIDDIRIYNRELNDNEILALYYEGTSSTISFANQTATVGRTIEIPVNTSELTANDNVIAYQFDFEYDNIKLEYIGNSIAGTLAENGSLQVNPTTNKLSIAWARQTPIIGTGAILKLQFKSIDAGITTPTITNAFFNTSEISSISNGTITSNYKYGDIDVNDLVQAYDAALAIQYSVGLDPIPTIDPFPWENWRIKVADVDGLNGVTANDASEILKYTVGLINIFPVENNKKSGKSDKADIFISLINNEFIFKSSGELFGLNIFVTENIESLGQPQFLNTNMLTATNISTTSYAIGLATTYSPAEGEAFLKIPLNIDQNTKVTFDIIVNNKVKSITAELATGIVDINEKSISVFPNPTNSILYLSGVQKAFVQIFDLSGKLLMDKQISNNQIDVSSLKNGIYSLKITNENGKSIHKFVKQ